MKPVVNDFIASAITGSNGKPTAPDDWPEPEELGEDLPAVPPFDLEMLPASFRPLVEDVSERMQTPPDIAAAAAIVTLGGATGRRARIWPKAQDSTWIVVPNLWGANVAPPGFMKTPAMVAITAPLAHVQQMWRAEHSAEVAAHELDKEKKKLDHDLWKERYKSAKRKGEEPIAEPDTTLRPPVNRRLLANDATPEKLQEILAENPAGIFILRDELVGLIAEMDKEGRETQRAFFLECWNGYGAYATDRIGRGSTDIPNVCLSIFGNIQPARLRSYLSDALEGGPGDDGLFQRFQILVWPDATPEWKLVDRPPNNSAMACAEKVLSRLANMPTESVRMKFSPDAQQLFYAWWAKLEAKVRTGDGLHQALVAHLAKYRSLMPSLAGLFELADLIAEDRQVGEDIEIQPSHAEQAVKLCTYLEAHAKRVYSCITSAELHAARLLAKHIERGALPETFVAREIYQRDWAALDNPERVAGALAVLEEANWARREKSVPSANGGRPKEVWRVSPKIRPA